MPETATHTVTDVVTWFEIPAANLERAINFYNAILEAPLQRIDFNGTPMAVFPHDEPGVGGCLVQDEHPSPHGTLVFLNVEGRLDRTLELVPGAGGRVATPKVSIGPHGWSAHIIDSEGNRVGLHSKS
ncbi:MAG: VOC family protein [Vulcanimicrobiaceae bacterium]|jgi:predicted enzyme related to lactoylglutathione lyase